MSTNDGASSAIAPGTAWRRLAGHRYLVPAAVYVASRLAVVIAILAAMALRPGSTFISHLTAWDVSWYLDIARGGYPSEPDPLGQNHTAFFPLFPLMTRALAEVSPLGLVGAGVVISLAGGLAATLLLVDLGQTVTDTRRAQWGAVLFALFPASYVFNVPYSEGLMIALAAGALVAAARSRWLVAGGLGALVTATRPNGIGVVAALAVAALIDHRANRGTDRGTDRARRWRPIAAVVLAPLGLLAFFAFLGFTTGDFLVSVRAQQAWGQGLDFGLTTARALVRSVTDPLDNLNRVAMTFALLVAAAGAAVLIRRRCWVLLAYSATIMVPVIVASSFGSRPRFVLAAFPLIAALGWQAKEQVSAAIAAAFAVLLVVAAQLTLTGLWLVP